MQVLRPEKIGLYVDVRFGKTANGLGIFAELIRPFRKTRLLIRSSESYKIYIRKNFFRNRAKIRKINPL